MSTVALQNVWNTLLGYNLSTANKRWLAELNARIDQSEADIAAGRVYTMEEARRHRKEYMAKLLNS